MRDEEAIRARKHPLAVLGVWAWETGLASVGAWPAASLVRAVYGNDPRGDGPLWTPGAHALLDLLWRDAHGVSEAARALALALAIGAVAGLLPMTAMMVAMAHGDPARRRFAVNVSGALDVLPAMAALLILMTAAEALAVGAGVFLGTLAESLAHVGLGEARAQQLATAIVVPFLVFAGVMGVTHDLARAAVVRRRAGPVGALVAGAAAFRADPLSLAWSWAWRAIAAVVPVFAVGMVAERLGGRGVLALAILAILHQGVVLGRVALRASWLATGLRRLAPFHHLDASAR